MAEFTPQILRFDSLSSTNLEAAKRAIEGQPEGLCVVAREQTAGRGRLQRDWVSPKDAGLYFSIVLRPQLAQSLWPLLTLMAAVAVHDALLGACALKTDIKWPNDILVNDKKLCGILGETVETALGRALVLGIGINLTGKVFPAELKDTATSVDAVTGEISTPEAVLQAVIRALQRRYEMLHLAHGTENIIREWSERSSYASGKRVRVSNGDEELEGTTNGLDLDGALRVKTDTGEIRMVRAGDVSSVRPSDRHLSTKMRIEW
ncbi:MAG: biotin--[acetyl-CoA-carboxylase] ligase [Acidobacteriota bacterium]|nr:biotin--[acetyl-CoA-carboxylase] ligase [Acidobacteriota bacterium]